MAITTSGTTLTFNDATTQTTAPVNTNANVNSVSAGTNITVSSTTGAVTINASSYPLTSGTVVASTSGTSIDFTSIPSWVKRITVIFNNVSLSASANYLIQIGVSGTPTTTGYTSSCSYNAGSGGNGVVTSTSGFVMQSGTASYTIYGSLSISTIGSNTWVSNGVYGNTATVPFGGQSAGTVALSGTLNIIRITTTSTDTFDAGSINILYE